MALDEPNDDDARLDMGGIELLTQKSMRAFLDGQIIDFVNSGYREGFVISPESGAAC